MATRCDIIIKDYGTQIDSDKKWKQEIKLYHHHDGYPEYLGKFLMEQIMPKLETSNCISCEDIANFLIKHKEDDEFEITLWNHCDIEYRYVIDIPKKQIQCFKGRYKDWDSPRPRFTVTMEMDLNRFKPLLPTESYK